MSSPRRPGSNAGNPTGHTAAGGAARPAGRASVGVRDGGPPADRAGRATRPPAASRVYGGPPPRRPVRRGKPRWGRIALVVVAAAVVLGLLFVGGLSLYGNTLNKNLTRTDPFSALTGGRPTKTVNGAVNMLLVGSDSRDPDATLDKASEWRADTMMIMHIPADHQNAYLVSLPRDLYVPVVEAGSNGCRGERAKINAAFAFGGLPQLVRTVECFSDVRMDHVVAIDFAGFKDVTNALGGVDMTVDQTITSIHKPFRTYKKGKRHFTGFEALDYVRQRKQYADGDFTRVKHQQMFLRALMDKAASSGTITNPAKLNAFLKAATRSLTADKDFSLVDMALQFRGLRSQNLTFMTSPHLGSQDINGESVVVSDREKALGLYQAIARDRLADWVKANPK
ncbi:transcriptional regulator [Pilimelia terevasa]|uniref:Transcriptional regulator n=1 Tax=Pilimelia terevasa TaxID=53372 RepID=A0A8J3FIJ9_9ACTN|nr:transcriptional regulator [Pilimelia terevasa]